MAIAPLQLPSSAPFTPSLDFSPIAKLGDVYREAQQRRTLADLGAGLADGSLDYRSAAGKLASTGNLTGVVSLLQLGEAQRKRDAELAAGQQFSQSLSSLYGGGAASGAPVASASPSGGYGNAIASIESGGRYDALGPVTRTGDRAYGKYQVMGRNIGPWTQEVLGRAMTPQEFVASPQAQDAVFKAKFGSYVQKYGPEGAARAWFAGEGGMNDPNRRDQLGTSVADYGRRFTAAMGGQGPGDLPANAQPAQGVLPQAAPESEEAISPRLMGLIRARNIPNLPAAQRETIDKLIAIEQDRAKRPDAIRKYQFAVNQGYRGSFMDFEKELKRAGAMNIDMGTIPPGYRAIRDADGRVIAVEPLPGSKDARAAADADRKAAAAGEQKDRYADVVTTDIDRAIKAIDGGILPTTGFLGEKLKGVGGTGAHDLDALLTTIRANIGFDRLQALRDASPTGGALGQVSDFENRQLQATLGNLEQSQSAKQLKENLNRVYNTYLDIIHGPGNGPARRPVGGAASSQPARSAAPRRVNDEAAYRLLPSGTRFVAPDGSVRIKP